MFSKSLFKKMADNRKKNTVRKITKEVKEIINNRDKVCIISGGPIECYHHAWYGLSQNLGPNRNDPDQLVGLCHTCHYKLHFQGDNDYREQAIEYLNNYYGKIQG